MSLSNEAMSFTASLPPVDGLTEHGGGYLRLALYGLPSIIAQAPRVIPADLQYDTIVGTGLSGTLVVPALAVALSKHFLIVRKSVEHNHSGQHEGLFGRRWVFVDDLIASGDTLRTVRGKILGLCAHSEYCGAFTYGSVAGEAKWRINGYDE